jgi:DNA repair photolyase
MTIREIEAKSILRKHKKIDSWFVARYGMNLYRGCHHNCVYCDGRSEGYHVEGEFGKDVAVKANAIEILHRELDPKRKRVPFKPSFIMLGGGVGDSFQPVEKTYELIRKTLGLLRKYNHPVHILTKSTLVERDLDLIKRINDQNRAIVSFSFSSTSDEISAVFEPCVPSPSERLKTLQIFKREGIPVGMFLLPIIPFVTDSRELIEEAVKKARMAGADFIIFGGMTLKPGGQSDYLFKALNKVHPGLCAKVESIYDGNRWGQATGRYVKSISARFNEAAKKMGLPKRVPPALFTDILWENDLVIVLLEHIDYLLKLEGRHSPFGFAAYSISKQKEPISTMKNDLEGIKGINQSTADLIWEILDTGTSAFLEELLFD